MEVKASSSSSGGAIGPRGGSVGSGSGVGGSRGPGSLGGADLAVRSCPASECPLCLAPFDAPRNLPCGHTVCTPCLATLPRPIPEDPKPAASSLSSSASSSSSSASPSDDRKGPAAGEGADITPSAAGTTPPRATVVITSGSGSSSSGSSGSSDDLRVCYARCPGSFALHSLPRAFALEALIQSTMKVDFKSPEVWEMFLIDTSSSMWYSDRALAFLYGESRLVVARSFVTKIIEQRRGVTGHWVSIMTFDTECRSLVQLETGEKGLNSACAALRDLEATGRETALLDAVAVCYRTLRDHPHRAKRLIILTDGADTISNGVNKERYARLAEELAGGGRSLRIQTVLVNTGGDVGSSKGTADKIGAAFIDLTEKDCARKVNHYISTYPSTAELRDQWVAAQEEEFAFAVSALPAPVVTPKSATTSRSTTTTPAVSPLVSSGSSSSSLASSVTSSPASSPSLAPSPLSLSGPSSSSSSTSSSTVQVRLSSSSSTPTIRTLYHVTT